MVFNPGLYLCNFTKNNNKLPVVQVPQEPGGDCHGQTRLPQGLDRHMTVERGKAGKDTPIISNKNLINAVHTMSVPNTKTHVRERQRPNVYKSGIQTASTNLLAFS